MENAYVYARYSSDKQTEDSIEAQLRSCRAYAAAHDLNIVGIYTDEAISGKGSKTAARTQYQKMLRDCDESVTVILIHKYDRIARSLGEHVNLEARLKRKGIRLIATSQDFGQSSEAKIMRALMWSLSEYYIDNLASETRKGLKETALKGLHTGGYAPFGYDVVDQHYIINDLEAGYVRRIFSAAAGREGFAEILAEMSAAGIVGKRGKPIRYTQIYEMLRNEKYTGVYMYSPEEEKERGARRDKPNAIRIENALPPIISKEQFMEVQKIMRERKHSGRRAKYLCSGLVYCECGAKMHGITTKRKGHEYRYFVCSKKCGASVVSMDIVDDVAISYLHELLSEQNQTRIVDALRNYRSCEQSHADEFKAALNRRIQDKKAQLRNLTQNLASGVLPPEVVQDIGVTMQTIRSEIAALEATEPPKDYTVDQIRSWLNSLKACPDEKAVHLLVERIDIKQKTDIKVTSSLTSVLGNTGCGGRI